MSDSNIPTAEQMCHKYDDKTLDYQNAGAGHDKKINEPGIGN
jgi:hypothetical protein